MFDIFIDVALSPFIFNCARVCSDDDIRWTLRFKCYAFLIHPDRKDSQRSWDEVGVGRGGGCGDISVWGNACRKPRCHSIMSVICQKTTTHAALLCFVTPFYIHTLHSCVIHIKKRRVDERCSCNAIWPSIPHIQVWAECCSGERQWGLGALTGGLEHLSLMCLQGLLY